MTTQPEIVDAIQAGMNRVQATFGQLSEAQLDTKIHDGENGWTARQILAHLAGRQATYDMLISLAIDSNGASPAGFDIDTWNQRLVEERDGRSREDLLAEFRTVHEALIERSKAFREDQFTLPIVLPHRETTLGGVLLGSGGMHSIQHSREVEEALGLNSDEK